jgi:hypothetical protein
MDSIPIVEVLARCDSRFARAWFRWFFLGQTEKPAERLINANPGAWYTTTSEHMGEEAFADYAGRFTIPRRGMCEDYRAGLAIDWKHDEADRAAGRKVSAPTLLLWSEGETSLSSSVIHSQSGASGRTMFALTRSTAATIWLRRRRSSLLKSSACSFRIYRP